MSRLSVLCALAAVSTPVASQARDLSGHWVLQGDRGDTTAEAPPAAEAPPSGGPVPSGRRERDPGQRQLALLIGMAGSVPAFTINQSDSTITVTNGDGFSYVLRPGGEEQELTILDSIVVAYRARWDGSFLEVEWRPDGGGKLTERYQLADSGLYLRIDVSVEHARFRRAESRMYRLDGGGP